MEIQVNCFCVRTFHESEGWMKYPYTKTLNLISRQGYITNWFLFVCCTTFVLITLMFNVKYNYFTKKIVHMYLLHMYKLYICITYVKHVYYRWCRHVLHVCEMHVQYAKTAHVYYMCITCNTHVAHVLQTKTMPDFWWNSNWNRNDLFLDICTSSLTPQCSLDTV